MGIKFETPQINTENLILRKLTVNDAEDIYFIRSNKENTKYVDFKPYEDVARAERFINAVSEDVDNGVVAFWGICINTVDMRDKVIGTVCLMPYEATYDTVEVGYELNRDFWGKGIMREALEAIIEFCFKELSIKCIYADTNINNKPSLKLLAKFNFLEGEKVVENNFKYFYLKK